MSIGAEQVISEALELPALLRALVAEKLIESLDIDEGGELSPRWKEEIRRRCDEIDRAVVKLSDADTVFTRAFDSLA